MMVFACGCLSSSSSVYGFVTTPNNNNNKLTRATYRQSGRQIYISSKIAALHPPSMLNYSPLTLLQASSSAAANSDALKDSEPPTLLSRSYRMMKSFYLLLGIVLTGINERTNGLALDRKFGAMGGLVCAAGIAHILATANDHNRLSSDTYQRLNVGLVGYNLLGILAFPGEGGLFRNMNLGGVPYICTSMFCYGFGAYTAFTGWKRGVASSELWNTFKEGTKKTLQAIRKTHSRGTGYRNVLVGFLIGIAGTFASIVHHSWMRKPLLETSLLVTGLGRLFLLSTMLFSLKDAGERNRLKGTTFIQMNYLIGLWFFLTGIGQAIVPGAEVLAPASALLPFSAIFFMGGYIYHLEKIGKLEYIEGSKGRWIVVDEKGWNTHFFDR